MGVNQRLWRDERIRFKSNQTNQSPVKIARATNLTPAVWCVPPVRFRCEQIPEDSSGVSGQGLSPNPSAYGPMELSRGGFSAVRKTPQNSGDCRPGGQAF